MDKAIQTKNPMLFAISEHWGLFVFWGILLVILGILALVFDTLTTLVSVVFLGAVIFIGGAIIVINAFRFWRIGWSTFLLHIIIGLLYIIAGIMLFTNPVTAAISLTLILGIFYIVLGIVRFFNLIFVDTGAKGWKFFNGLIALLLGIFILAHWPASSLFIIGLFVGVDLIVTGVTYIMLALSTKGRKVS